MAQSNRFAAFQHAIAGLCIYFQIEHLIWRFLHSVNSALDSMRIFTVIGEEKWNVRRGCFYEVIKILIERNMYNVREFKALITFLSFINFLMASSTETIAAPQPGKQRHLISCSYLLLSVFTVFVYFLFLSFFFVQLQHITVNLFIFFCVLIFFAIGL